MASVSETSNGSRCRGRNRAGLPRSRRAGRDGYCTVHGPNAQDMRELGRKGGRAHPSSRSAPPLAGALRERGRQELEKLLTDEDPRIRLRAASVVASYSPERERITSVLVDPLQALRSPETVAVRAHDADAEFRRHRGCRDRKQRRARAARRAQVRRQGVDAGVTRRDPRQRKSGDSRIWGALASGQAIRPQGRHCQPVPPPLSAARLVLRCSNRYAVNSSSCSRTPS
jgi:hypothetical protein